MSYTQKDTHGLHHINGGLHALRRALAARIPSDFEWTFLDNGESVQVSYVWTGDGECEYQNEIAAPTVRELLIRWQAVNWESERARGLRARSALSAGRLVFLQSGFSDSGAGGEDQSAR